MIFDRTSTNAPSAVRIRVFGPLLHLPKQFTLTTGTDGGVRNVNVAKVASEPFSRHLRNCSMESISKIGVYHKSRDEGFLDFPHTICWCI